MMSERIGWEAKFLYFGLNLMEVDSGRDHCITLLYRLRQVVFFSCKLGKPVYIVVRKQGVIVN